jgi:hypothetical protein
MGTTCVTFARGAEAFKKLVRTNIVVILSVLRHEASNLLVIARIIHHVIVAFLGLTGRIVNIALGINARASKRLVALGTPSVHHANGCLPYGSRRGITRFKTIHNNFLT